MPAGRPTRPPITREQVVERAFAVVDAEGLDALSMRRLGTELGVAAASLYYHVQSREELLDLLVMRLRADVTVPDPMPSRWQEAIVEIFANYASTLSEHPHLVPLAGRVVPTDPATHGLTSLIESGVPRDVAVHVWQSAHALVLGFALVNSRTVDLAADGLDPLLVEGLHGWGIEGLRRALRAVTAEAS
jgi:TetR/AcrR family tetracycline transcriptional repressor